MRLPDRDLGRTSHAGASASRSPRWCSRHGTACPISVLIRPSVHRWSLANPCASGPFRSSISSRAHCCGLSFSRDTGPLDRSASAPPSRQAWRHRRTDPSVTLRSRAISLIVSPRANRSAASSRSRSRRCCSAGVYPPRCAYRMLSSYARNQPTSRPALYELILVSGRRPGAKRPPARWRRYDTWREAQEHPRCLSRPPTPLRSLGTTLLKSAVLKAPEFRAL